MTAAYAAHLGDEPQVYEPGEFEADSPEEAEALAQQQCREDNGFDADEDPLVDVFACPVVDVTMLCVRDPDWENMYVSDGDVRHITIDIGGNWNSYKDFSSCLRDGDETAVEFEQSLLADVADLAPENPVRQAVEEYFAEARRAD